MKCAEDRIATPELALGNEGGRAGEHRMFAVHERRVDLSERDVLGVGTPPRRGIGVAIAVAVPEKFSKLQQFGAFLGGIIVLCRVRPLTAKQGFESPRERQ